MRTEEKIFEIKGNGKHPYPAATVFHLDGEPGKHPVGSELNGALKACKTSIFVVLTGKDPGEILARSIRSLARPGRPQVIFGSSEDPWLSCPRSVWKFMRGFDEALSGKEVVMDFMERIKKAREFIVMEVGA